MEHFLFRVREKKLCVSGVVDHPRLDEIWPVVLSQKMVFETSESRIGEKGCRILQHLAWSRPGEPRQDLSALS